MLVAVIVHGHVVYNEGLGYADIENGVKCSNQTRMRVASISKPMTAAGLAVLLEKVRGVASIVVVGL